MMDPVCNRYAHALYDVAARQQKLEQVEADVRLIGDTLRDNHDVGMLLSNPQVPDTRKKEILGELLGARVAPLTLQFCRLLVDKRRLNILGDLPAQFQRLADDTAGIIRARVQTAVELSPEQQSRLLERLEHLTGKQVIVQASVEPAIGGGVVVWIGDRVIDGSIAASLKDLGARLSSSAVSARSA
jgi:F-type H+-transporting ATPase subunit delta